MNTFFIRVELHAGVYADYINLHTAMQNAGIGRHLVSGSINYQLPTAEYVFVGNTNTAALLQSVRGIVTSSTHKTAAILVVQAMNWSTDGLQS